jgi:hypothetical protein
MEGRRGLAAGGGYQWLGTEEETLDRALVAGLMLHGALDGPALPPEPQACRVLLKSRLQKTLVSHLSGRITLDRFHSLIKTLDRCFPFYYSLLTPLLLRPGDSPGSRGTPALEMNGPFSTSRPVRGNLLLEAMRALPGLLPRRPHSKVTGQKLQDFLGRTRGGWFRVRDFQEHFAVDRKTAWEYVQKFLHSGLLVHNQGRDASVRYALAERFLKVRGQALRREVALVLGDLPSHLHPQVADGLIASSGEPFWEKDWRRFLPTAYSQEILHRLTASGSFLEVVCTPDGSSRLLRLQSGWLQSPHHAS